VILTSAPRSGREVRITEAERPRRIHPGRRGCQAGIAVRSTCSGRVALCRDKAAFIRGLHGSMRSAFGARVVVIPANRGSGTHGGSLSAATRSGPSGPGGCDVTLHVVAARNSQRQEVQL
jgi:hypothetical protein